VNGIQQRAAKSIECYFHDVALDEADSFTEAECGRAEEVHVNVAGAPVRVELEMMMLHVRQAVAHERFAGAEFFRPQNFAASLDRDFAFDGVELRIDDQLRSDRALA
jgi:hypothetical protein